MPGCASGWEALLERFGSRPFAELCQPSIRYATEGFPVSPVVSRDWRMLSAAEGLRDTFYPGGPAPKPGEIFKNPGLAAFYEYLAKEGPAAFYHGDVADKIVAHSDKLDGLLTKKDFEDHHADWVDPVSTDYRGHDVWEIPPNGQGIATLQMLNLLEHFDIASMEPNSAEHLHLLAEAKKLAYEDRGTYYADQDFADVPVEQLISKAYAAERVKLIDPKRAATNVGPGALDGSTDTTYLTAADGEGNMISLIQSIYSGWGSQIVPGDLGFAMQNRGESFSLDPTHRNKLEPHKRPFHTIIPAFVTKGGNPFFSFGVMGGAFQPQGQAQVLMNLLDFGMSPQQAGEHPKMEHSGDLRFEQGIPEETRQQLADMGHEIRKGNGAFGGYQGIQRADAPLRYFGGSDPRKDGCAMGW